LKAESAETR